MARAMTPEEFQAAQAAPRVMTPEEFAAAHTAPGKTPMNTGLLESVPYQEGGGFAENAGRALHNVIPDVVNAAKGMGKGVLNSLLFRPLPAESETPAQSQAALEEGLYGLLDTVKHPIKTFVEHPATTAATAYPLLKGATAGAGSLVSAANKVPGINEALLGPEMKTITTAAPANGTGAGSALLDSILSKVVPGGRATVATGRAIKDAMQESGTVTKQIPAYPRPNFNPDAERAVQNALSRPKVSESSPASPGGPTPTPAQSAAQLAPEQLQQEINRLHGQYVTGKIDAPEMWAKIRDLRSSAEPPVTPGAATAPARTEPYGVEYPGPEMTPATSPTDLERIMQKRAAAVPSINAGPPDLVVAMRRPPRVVKGKMTNGETIVGKPGENHGDLFDRMPEAQQNENFEEGFADSSGKFYNRKDAAAIAKSSIPGKLDSNDLPAVQKALGSLSSAPQSELEQVLRGSKPISPELAGRYGVTPESQALDIQDMLHKPAVPFSMKDVLQARLSKYGQAAKVAEPVSPEDVINSAGLRLEGVTPEANLPKGMKGKGGLYMFTDPKTGSTLAMPESEITPEALQAHVDRSRSNFGVKE